LTTFSFVSEYYYLTKDSHLHLFGRLYHEYIVINYAKIELGRLNYLKFNQPSLRVDKYKCVQEVLNSDQSIPANEIGKLTILPSSFTGSPRHMSQLFQDAIACMRVHGKPDLFITFTANPNWPEITAELHAFQKSHDRPDLITRVFNLKLKCLLDDILKKEIFGAVVAHIYVIEFQKRGLPHAHILICLAEQDKVKTVEIVDLLVNAELPDMNKHKKVYETVTTCLLHGPCGPAYPKAPCMVDGVCSKNYPKDFQEETILASDR
jgi:hypothetical protein